MERRSKKEVHEEAVASVATKLRARFNDLEVLEILSIFGDVDGKNKVIRNHKKFMKSVLKETTKRASKSNVPSLLRCQGRRDTSDRVSG